VRAAILADIKAGTLSRAKIAATHGVSRASVTNIATTAGVTDPFDRTATQKATQVAAVDARAARARLCADLMLDALRLRERAWAPYPVVTNTADGPEITMLPQPPLRDVQAAYTALGIAIDKALKVDAYDRVDESLSGLDAWLQAMTGR